MNEPILQYVKDHVKEGKLDPGFSLDEYRGSYSMSFIDGAVDGIAFFHGHEEADRKVVDFLTACTDLKDEDDVERAFDEIEEYFNTYEGSIIYTVDAVSRYIMDHEKQLDGNMLYALSEKLIREGETINGVKYGITLAHIFQKDSWESLKDAVEVLALCEEFALYISTFVIDDMANRNEIRRKLAEKLSGWGKVFMVTFMENTDKETESWMIANGADNVISPGYVSTLILSKIDIDELYSRTLSDEEITGLSLIINGLLFDAPLHDINSLISRDELVRGFLDLRSRAAHNVEYYCTLTDMYFWFDLQEQEDDFIIDVRQRLTDMFADKETEAFLKETLPDCDSYYFNKLCDVAMLNETGDFTDIMFERFNEDPCLFAGALTYLMNSRRRDQVVKRLDQPQDFSAYLYDEFVSPSMLNLSALLEALQMFPFTGMQYVTAGLRSRFFLIRHSALETIESWLSQRTDVDLIEYPDDIYDALKEISEKDESNDLKQLASQLLHPEEWQDDPLNPAPKPS